jgi:hypothetical protein
MRPWSHTTVHCEIVAHGLPPLRRFLQMTVIIGENG